MNRIYTAILIALTASFFVCDRYLYRYGQSTFSFYRLPMNIRVYHRYAFEGGSYIEDCDPIGMPLFKVGYAQKDKSGNRFWASDFLGYGFQNDTLFVKLLDSAQGVFYEPFTYLPAYKRRFKEQPFRRSLPVEPVVWVNMKSLTIERLQAVTHILILVFFVCIIAVFTKIRLH